MKDLRTSPTTISNLSYMLTDSYIVYRAIL